MLSAGALRLSAGLCVALAAWMSAGRDSAVAAEGPSGSGSVVCEGSECVISAVGADSNGGTGQPAPARPPAEPGRPTAAPSDGGGQLSELNFLLGLYESGMTAFQIIDIYGRAVVTDPVTGEHQFLAGLPTDEDLGGVAAPQLPSPAQLAQVAVSRLRLPTPAMGTSPSGDQVVSVPTWLWVDAASWRSVTATAAVPGVSVTATAVPVSAVWSMGTGDSVTCSGPGTPYGPGSDPASGSPDCGYTYARSSADQPGERFPVTVTVSWRVSWAGGGQSGVVEGMSTTASTGLRVREVQAVVVAVS